MLHPCNCRDCGEEFQTWEARKIHCREVHGKTQSRTNCECHECGDVFMSRKARHHHQMQTHRNVRIVVTPYSSRRAKRQRRIANGLALAA